MKKLYTVKASWFFELEESTDKSTLMDRAREALTAFLLEEDAETVADCGVDDAREYQ